MKILCFIILLFLPVSAFTQVSINKYRLYLNDKDNNAYRIEAPEEFLSSKSIQRRTRYNIGINYSDLPVSEFYLDSLEQLGLEIKSKSKWLNTVVVHTTNTDLIDTIIRYGFIRAVKTHRKIESKSYNLFLSQKKSKLTAPLNNYNYGEATRQITMVNGDVLHRNGFQGQGMIIAVLDGGFEKVDMLPAFDSLRSNNQILGTRNFVDGDTAVFEASAHGMKVLSIMAGNIPNQFVGVAPKAKYWLLLSEKVGSEYTVEEDYWVAAAELADSVGVDIITSSLGYATFDDSEQNYTYANMDGNTAFITKAADIAASKGILVVNSAGNEGATNWRHITAPADGDSVFTVGAVDENRNLAGFSSLGPTYDGRIKPNVCAMGLLTALQEPNGTIAFASGTSYSTPIISGMAACLWQKYPNLNNIEIIRKIERSAHKYNNSDNFLGYGIPNFALAAEIASSSKQLNLEDYLDVKIFPNPFIDYINIEVSLRKENNLRIEIFNSYGSKLTEKIAKVNSGTIKIKLDELSRFSAGVYFVKIQVGNQFVTKVISKIE